MVAEDAGDEAGGACRARGARPFLRARDLPLRGGDGRRDTRRNPRPRRRTDSRRHQAKDAERHGALPGRVLHTSPYRDTWRGTWTSAGGVSAVKENCSESTFRRNSQLTTHDS